MFTSIRVGNENFIIMPERAFKALVREGISADISGSRPLTKEEISKILSEMEADHSEGMTSPQLRKLFNTAG